MATCVWLAQAKTNEHPTSLQIQERWDALGRAQDMAWSVLDSAKPDEGFALTVFTNVFSAVASCQESTNSLMKKRSHIRKRHDSDFTSP
jgi:hypothetical protein